MGSRGATGSQLSGRSEIGHQSRRMTKAKEIYCASSGRATAMSELLEASQDERDEELRQTEVEDQNEEAEGHHQVDIDTSQARNHRLAPSSAEASNIRRSSSRTNHCHAHSHQHQHPHPHAPTCSHATHLFGTESGSTLLHSHQMHPVSHQCVHHTHQQPHHKPSCSMLHAHHATGVQARPSRFNSSSSNKERLLLAQFNHQTRPLKQIPNSHLKRPHVDQRTRATLLLRRAPEVAHLRGDFVGAAKVASKLNLRAETGGASRGSTSVKFISQLYFLIHLSAMISLLLHHKNLDSSERRLAIRQQQKHLHTLATLSGNNEQQLHYVTSTTKRNIQQPNRSLEGTPPPNVRALPEPQMFRAATWANSSHTPATFGPRKVRSHIGSEEDLSSQQQNDSRSSDILVRLVGRLHAKCALQYFLCYLLSSSITVLVFLWLIRVFTRPARAKLQLLTTGIQFSQPDGQQKSSRQDCTPVLIGSISLGLIQLIVIGLDIADNVDWLASANSKGADLAHKWPILLPFLQFSFVSLLMQFILAQVAKNRDSVEEVSLATVAREQRLSSATRTSREFEQRRASDNAQNIALAHLLVTHILLWLMRMNSISLFQANEPQVFLVSPLSPGSFAPPFTSIHSSNDGQGEGDRRKLDLTAKDNGPSERAVESNAPASSSTNITTATSTTTSTTTTRAPQLQSTDSTTSAPGETFQLDLIEKGEPKLIDLGPSTGSPTGLPSLPVQSTSNRPISPVAASNAAKSERDLRSSSKPPTAEPKRASKGVLDTRDLGDTSAAPERKRSHSITSQRAPHQTTPTHPSLSSSPPPPLKFFPTTTTSTTTTTTTPASTEAPILLASPKPLSVKQLGLGGELPQPNITANLFRSSIPKRMTAFRQTRPNQRINLSTPGSAPTDSADNSAGGPTTRSTLSTPHPYNQREAEPTPKSKHKVRVFVSRDGGDGGDSNSNSIDLSAVIPTSALPNKQADAYPSNQDEETETQHGNDPPTRPKSQTTSSTTSTTSRPHQAGAISQRPFPSVDEEPAPVRFSRPQAPLDYKAAASSAGPSSEQKPAESAQQKAPVEISRDKSIEVTRRKMNGPPEIKNLTLKIEDAAQLESESEYEDDPSSQSDDGPEEDLDALLPPPPNYDDDSVLSNRSEASSSQNAMLADSESNQMSAEEMDALLASSRIPLNDLVVARGGRKLMPSAVSGRNETLRQLALLDEEAFVFNEAASVAHKLTTRRPAGQQNNTLLQLELVGRLPLASAPNEQQRHAEWQQQQNQNEHQQQPTFTEFLLPIVQQYHILVLTILFNMWLDSMQSGASIGRDLVQEDPSTAPKSAAIARSRSNSLASQLSSCNSDRSLHSSTRQLVTLENFELARHQQGRRARAASLSEDNETDAFCMRNPTARSPDQISSSSSVSSNNSAANDNQAPPVRRQRNLFWYDKRRRSQAHQRLLMSRPGHHNKLLQAHYLASTLHQARQHKQPIESSGSSACSLFFGLLVVSGSLIVILLNLDLLSLLTQCAIQLVSILVCLLGLCCIWRLRRSLHSSHGKLKWKSAPMRRSASELPQQVAASQKSSFHYLFLLAAYYCGISIALNLGQQYHSARLFPQPVVKFVQRHYAASRQQQLLDANSVELELEDYPVRIVNFQLIFHALLVLKGLILIVQVTVQTVLIRSSWGWPSGRCELRQLYNLLMFANLSLWALEICDQQQQMQLAKQQQQHQLLLSASGQLEANGGSLEHGFELLTLDGFTRFASSVVTLSHLYHGLVFMQH